MVITVAAPSANGPERQPQLARTRGDFDGRMQRYVNDVKADISREMELDELRKLQATVQDAAHAIEQTVNKEITSTESELNSIAQTAAQAMQPAAETPAAEIPVIDAAAPPAAETPPTAPSVQGQLDLGSEQLPPARKQA